MGMDGGPTSVQERPIWLIWTVCAYDIYRECVWSEIKSAHAKIITNMHPGSRWTLCVNGVKRWLPRSYAAGE